MIRLPECPICGKTVPPASDPNATYAPFCSRRCKEVDLRRWCDGKYAIVESIDPTKASDLLDENLLPDEENESPYEPE